MRPTLTFAAGALAAFFAFALPADAIERTGAGAITFEGHAGRHTFTTTFDPSSGTFERKGEVETPFGGHFAYIVSGKCDPSWNCTWSGEAKGPLGGKWSGNGTVKHQDPDHAVLSGTITTPMGSTFTFSRDTGGDRLPLQRMWQGEPAQIP